MRRQRRGAPPGYVYPFGPNATTGRIDQGQDFGGTGPIRAIGRAKIVRLGAPGWPGGNGVLYKLLEGPYAGRHVFVYEGIKPSVRAGQIVAAGQTIGSLIPGSSTGIEIGWADANGVPISHGEYTEGKETHGGKAMAKFLSGLTRSVPLRGISPQERKKLEALAKEEGGKIGIGGIYDVPGLKQAEEVAEGEKSPSDLASEILSSIFGDIHPEALMLNIGLVGGGAFLVYYGAALMLGVKKPVATPAKAAAEVAAVAPK